MLITHTYRGITHTEPVDKHFLHMENFVQEDLFAPNVTQMPRVSKSGRSSRTNRSKVPNVPEVRIPASPASGGAEIRLIRNPRRKRTISAYREQGAIVIQIPAKLPARELNDLIPEMVQRVLSREAREKVNENELFARSLELLAMYLPEFSERPVSVTWRTMNERWGSCTTVDRTIRISDRLNGVPQYVLDYILVHELIHLRIPDHGGDFQDLLDRFGDSDRACAFLEGYECGSHA